MANGSPRKYWKGIWGEALLHQGVEIIPRTIFKEVTQNEARYLLRKAAMDQLGEHPVDPIQSLTSVLKKKNGSSKGG
jgi:hypothetical protein